MHGIEALCVIAAGGQGVRHSRGGRDRRDLRPARGFEVAGGSKQALDAIAAAVPRKLLMVCCHEGRARLAAVRHGLQVGAQWVPEDQLAYHAFRRLACRGVGGLVRPGAVRRRPVEDVDARLRKKTDYRSWKPQAAQLKRKYAKEVQPVKRNAALKSFAPSGPNFPP